MTDRHLLLGAVIALCVAGLLLALIIALGGTDRIAGRIAESIAAAAPQKTAESIALATCPTPQDSAEQMHIIVTRRNGQFIAECMFVGSTGTYYRGGR